MVALILGFITRRIPACEYNVLQHCHSIRGAPAAITASGVRFRNKKRTIQAQPVEKVSQVDRDAAASSDNAYKRRCKGEAKEDRDRRETGSGHSRDGDGQCRPGEPTLASASGDKSASRPILVTPQAVKAFWRFCSGSGPRSGSSQPEPRYQSRLR